MSFRTPRCPLAPGTPLCGAGRCPGEGAEPGQKRASAPPTDFSASLPAVGGRPQLPGRSAWSSWTTTSRLAPRRARWDPPAARPYSSPWRPRCGGKAAGRVVSGCARTAALRRLSLQERAHWSLGESLQGGAGPQAAACARASAGAGRCAHPGAPNRADGGSVMRSFQRRKDAATGAGSLLAFESASNLMRNPSAAVGKAAHGAACCGALAGVAVQYVRGWRRLLFGSRICKMQGLSDGSLCMIGHVGPSCGRAARCAAAIHEGPTWPMMQSDRR